MPRMCPTPCGRLTTAAVFISIGVVQLLVGIILLRSDFADLLAGPDFMTASSNIGVGCVYGMAATVWKNKKKNPTKQNAKNNVLMSLLISVIAVNSTTVAVLMLGEGSNLLTRFMETRHEESATSLANEVLAGAYIASVCSPIVCIVISIVSLSGICFQAKANKQRNPVKSVLNVETPLDWNQKPHKKHADGFRTPASTLSSPDTDGNVFSDKPSSRKSKLSVRGFCSPPRRSESRGSFARSSNLLKRRSPLFNSSGPKRDLSDKKLIPRIKPSSFLRKSRHSQSDEAISYWDSNEKDYSAEKDLNNRRDAKSNTGMTRAQSSEEYFRKNSLDKTCSSEQGISNYSKNVSFDDGIKSTPTYSKSYGSVRVDDRAMPRDDSEIIAEVQNPSYMKLRVETLKELKTRIKGIPSSEPPRNQAIGILKQENRSANDETSSIPSIDYERSGSFDSNTSPEDETEKGRNQQSSVFSYSPNTNAYEADRQSTDDMRRYNAQRVHDTIMNGIRSKSLDGSLMGNDLDDRNSMPQDGRSKKNLVLDNPKVSLIKQQTRKREATKRMASMASISEIPQEDSGRRIDENSNITDGKDSVRSSQSGTGKRTEQSIKNRLKGIWSSSSETKMDILELIMDQDSLIGLSEDELMSRTRRIRELRKTVAVRLKSELKDAKENQRIEEIKA